MRYFDTAPLYGFGLSEHRVGECLKGLGANHIEQQSAARDLLGVHVPALQSAGWKRRPGLAQ